MARAARAWGCFSQGSAIVVPGASLLCATRQPPGVVRGWGRACSSSSGPKPIDCSDFKPQAKAKAPPTRTQGKLASGISYYAARAKPSDESASFYAAAESINQVVVTDGVCGADQGAAAAKFCATHILKLVAYAFHEQVRDSPLWAKASASGEPMTKEEAATDTWADALTLGFDRCDQVLKTAVQGGCGAMVCSVTRSGIYIGSVGLGRVVVGAEEGKDIMCDEASSPHIADNEKDRLGDGPPLLGPTRLLGGAAEKERDPRLLSLPDVVRQPFSEGRTFVVLGSPGIWLQGPRLPVVWAIDAYRAGRNPALGVIEQSGGDVVAMVLVIPPGMEEESSGLPAHDEVMRGAQGA